MNFGQALEAMKLGSKVTRVDWNRGRNISLEIQFPDINSKMTKPYIYMNKDDDKFPCDLSCESLLADDWQIILDDVEESYLNHEPKEDYGNDS
jgi:hypothetical protein